MRRKNRKGKKMIPICPDSLIHDTLINTHAKNVLIKMGFKKLKDLNGFSCRELLKFKGIGGKNLSRIQNILISIGLSLRVDGTMRFYHDDLYLQIMHAARDKFIFEDEYIRIVDYLKSRTHIRSD